jgi:hypothetical protein
VNGEGIFKRRCSKTTIWEDDMKRLIGRLVSVAALLVLAQGVHAQDQLVPAGTLLQCTMNEPNFSSKTAAIGDPVLCHLRTTTEFGRPMFPRGSMLGGHLEADKDPGHFVGKGSLKITFDRVILPNGDLPVPAKVIAARGYKVDKQGAIDGKGHATRDVVEWLFPPLWPWKVVSLPARGPYPALKGEEPLQLRLMDDIVIPRSLAVLHPDRPPYADQSSYHPDGTIHAMQLAAAQTQVLPRTTNVSQPAPLVATPATLQTPTSPSVPAGGQRYTMLVLNTNQVIAVAKFHREGDLLIITDAQGVTGSLDIDTVDFRRTSEMTNNVRSTEPSSPAVNLTRQLN